MIDLNPHHLRTVEHILAEHVPDREVRAFGSRVDWTANEYSDLDLAVCGSSPLSLETLYDLKEAFEESNLPIRVDVLDWHRTSDSFKKIIEKKYEQIQKAANNRSHDIRAGSPSDVPEAEPPTKSGNQSHGIGMPPAQEWKTTTIGEIAPLAYGRGLPARKRNPNGTVAVYGSNGVVGRHSTALTKGPTVIVGRKGSAGSVHYSSVPCWPIDTAFYVEGSDPELVRFKYYLLQSLGLDRMNSDSAVPGLNRNNAHAVEVRVPEVEGQRTISRILGTLDDKIELNRRRCETLEEMAQVLFKSWFVDFDPVRAKAEGRKTGLPKHLADLFPNRLEESELGPIPAGWVPSRLNDLMEVNPSRRLLKHEIAPYLAMANMPTRGHRPYQFDYKAFGSGMRFANGDTLVARITPCLENGKVAFVDFLDHGEVGWGSTEYIVLHPKPPFPRVFAYLLARTAKFRDFAVGLMTGSSGRQRVSSQALADFPISAAPVHIVKHFGEVVEPLIAKSAAATEEAQVLANLRDELLRRLVSGKLSVESR